MLFIILYKAFFFLKKACFLQETTYIPLLRRLHGFMLHAAFCSWTILSSVRHLMESEFSDPISHACDQDDEKVDI
jgi:hypothetical protein